jgi:hypothetical protein
MSRRSVKLKKKETSKFTRVNVQFSIAKYFKKDCYMEHVGAQVLIHLDIILKYVVLEGFKKLCLAQLSILQMFDIMDIYKRLPYYFRCFNTNYIIFKIVETFGRFFFQIKYFLEEILNQVRNSLFVERKNSKLIKLFNKHVSKLPRYYTR